MPADTNYLVKRLIQPDPPLLSQLDQLHRAFMGDSPVPPEQFMRFVAGRLADDAMLLILAMNGDNAIGYGMAFDVHEHPFMPEWQRGGYITQLFVSPEHRRCGVGRLLCDHILRWFASRGLKQALLNVLASSQAASQFWRSQNFAPHRIRMKRVI